MKRSRLHGGHNVIDWVRCGFSLIELLIVLAVLAAIASLTLPSLRGPMDKARLRGAAREIETAIAKSRSLAIRTGQPHWFTFEPGGRAWRIETNIEPVPGEGAGATATASGLTPDGPESEEVSHFVRGGVLPDGVTFSDESIQSADLVEPDVLLDAGPKWSEPIHFNPIGRTANRKFALRGARDFEVRVRVRGLTGSVNVALQRRIESVERVVLAEGSEELREPDTRRLQ